MTTSGRLRSIEFDNLSGGGLPFRASEKARGGFVGRLAQRESTCLTSRGSLVRIQYRPPWAPGSGTRGPGFPPECGVVVQLVRTPACQAGGRGFEPRRPRQLFSIRCAALRLPGVLGNGGSRVHRVSTPVRIASPGGRRLPRRFPRQPVHDPHAGDRSQGSGSPAPPLICLQNLEQVLAVPPRFRQHTSHWPWFVLARQASIAEMVPNASNQSLGS